MQRLRQAVSGAVALSRKWRQKLPRGLRKPAANDPLALSTQRRLAAGSAFTLTAFAWLTKSNTGYCLRAYKDLIMVCRRTDDSEAQGQFYFVILMHFPLWRAERAARMLQARSGPRLVIFSGSAIVREAV